MLMFLNLNGANARQLTAHNVGKGEIKNKSIIIFYVYSAMQRFIVCLYVYALLSVQINYNQSEDNIKDNEFYSVGDIQ